QRLERVAGLDVPKKTVSVCVRVPGARGARRQEVRTFGTTVPELLALREWLETQGVTHAAMESTGVYWKPVFYILEEAVTCLLANAAHIARVPGRKTDVQDCVWIAPLVEHGLVRGSFVPPAPIRDLRDLTRARKALSQDRTRAANRLHKVLEDAGIKLASVANDVLGVAGRPKSSSPRSAWICASSRPPNTSPAGPASARATVRARANTRWAPRARATAGCARPWSRPRYRRRGPPTVPSRRAIAGSCATGATRRR